MTHALWLPLLVFAGISHAYTATLLLVTALRRSNTLLGTSFTPTKYYLLMGWAPLAMLALGVWLDRSYLLFFPICLVVGVVGESLVWAAWRRFFAVPIWTYGPQALLGGITSRLNVLPWMVGGLLFLTAGRVGEAVWGEPAGAPPEVAALIGACAGVGYGGAWVVRRLVVAGEARRKAFSSNGLALFLLPVALVGGALCVVFDLRYAPLMASFAIVGSVTEYGYGRAMSLFFAGGLWSYNHLRVDGGHSSWVTLPLWSLGGLPFYLVGRQLGLG